MKRKKTPRVELQVRPKVRTIVRTRFPLTALRRTTKSLLSALECTEKELSVLLTDDAEIQFLNAHYRKKNKPTDVLSFPQKDSELLGDVVISLETASRQARKYRVTFREEVTRLVVHGTLHLLGYRHENVSRKTATRMWKKERELIEILRSAQDDA